MMKRRLFNCMLCLAAMALAVGCGSKDAFTISGTIPEGQYEGYRVLLFAQDSKNVMQDISVSDSAFIDKEGHFSMKGTVQTASYAAVYVVDSNGNEVMYKTFVLEPGKISLVITENDYTDRCGGTPSNDTIQAYLNRLIPLQTAYDDYVNSLDEDMRDRVNKLQHTYAFSALVEACKNDSAATIVWRQIGRNSSAVDSASKAVRWELYNKHSNSVVGLFALRELYALDYEFFQNDTLVDSLRAVASEPCASYLQQVLSQLQERKEVERKRAEAREKTAEGTQYVDIPGKVKTLVDGKWIEKSGSLKELIQGNVSLVDFWASWCGPCKDEIKSNLIPLYDKYKDAGLQVVGVDVWDEETAHAGMVEKMGIVYPQLIDSTQFSSDTYGIEGIPTILLIAADGKILARDLRGVEMEKEVKKALKIK